ncbi:MAG: ROK family protein [Pseudomonadota bacterium]
MRIGIDWGGTKIEAIALDENSEHLFRERVPTRKDDYHGCLKAVKDLVDRIETQTARTGTVGMGIPGTISPATGLVKNSNSVWMNGQSLLEDMETILDREVRIQNDANCFAVSEAVDGAGAGNHVVSGIIIGTGCGSGIAIGGKAWTGHQGIAGEFGHTALSPLHESEYPGNVCWCGRKTCLETYLSGTGFALEHQQRTGARERLPAEEILASNTYSARETYRIYCDRLARGLAMLINILDPDVVVLGGGMSNVETLYKDVPPLLSRYVFSDVFDTPIVKARFGDSSGVRGAAWLWN